MTNENTKNLGLPLPHIDNMLEGDVHRIVASFELLDAEAARQNRALEELYANKADAADMQNVAAALNGKADAEDTRIALQGKADTAAINEELAGKADKSALTATDASLATHSKAAATVKVSGHIQLASDAEATSGTVTTNAVTPKPLKAARDAGASPTRNDTAASYTSAGTGSSATGFKLADGSDIAEIFGKLDNVENAASGAGSFVSDVSLAVNGKIVLLNKKMATPGHCSYCAYCSHCSHCSYCACTSNCCNG